MLLDLPYFCQHTHINYTYLFLKNCDFPKILSWNPYTTKPPASTKIGSSNFPLSYPIPFPIAPSIPINTVSSSSCITAFTKSLVLIIPLFAPFHRLLCFPMLFCLLLWFFCSGHLRRASLNSFSLHLHSPPFSHYFLTISSSFFSKFPFHFLLLLPFLRSLLLLPFRLLL